MQTYTILYIVISFIITLAAFRHYDNKQLAEEVRWGFTISFMLSALFSYVLAPFIAIYYISNYIQKNLWEYEK